MPIPKVVADRDAYFLHAPGGGYGMTSYIQAPGMPGRMVRVNLERGATPEDCRADVYLLDEFYETAEDEAEGAVFLAEIDQRAFFVGTPPEPWAMSPYPPWNTVNTIIPTLEPWEDLLLSNAMKVL